jgi:Na+-transporting NADH:ubiquinone oxidoreductase subunit NqrB
MGEKLELLEQHFVSSDEKLAKLLYNSLAMTSFKNATRGVLYVKRCMFLVFVCVCVCVCP